MLLGDYIMTEENENMTPAEYFKENKYAIVDSAVPVDICQNLSDYILKLVEDKKTTKDEQCPLSESIYGDSMMEILLEDVRPTIEKATGLNLIPTYSYARKYLPGDELKPHLDRPACEISATITLGYEGGLWPIHVSTDDKVENDIGEILIDVGSMVVYRGEEINHWREPYTQGKWQCQVFLHYVNADGPHKDLKYDCRKDLGTKQTAHSNDYEPSTSAWIFGYTPQQKCLYMTKEDVLSAPLIDSIILHGSKNTELAQVGGDTPGVVGVVDKKIRNVSHSWLPYDKFEWLYSLIEEEIKNMNWLNYKYVLNSMEKIDYLEYYAGNEAGKYDAHIDGGIHSNRKLSFSLLLSDPSEYDGGDLLIYEGKGPIVVPKRQGMITFFPSNVLHEVTPVTRGVRRSIVSWIHGPVFC
jgi:predicted 2-oxoglutarate/Fe(II)-dependent dioxygenase YbiX